MKRFFVVILLLFFTKNILPDYASLGSTLYFGGTSPITLTAGLSLFSYDVIKKWYQRDQASNLTALRPAQPHKTVFVFDLHHVLFLPDYPSMVASFFAVFITTPQLWKIVLNYHVIKELIKALLFGQVGEQILHDISLIHPELAAFKDIGRRISNCQIPITQTFELMKQLKQRGFEIYLLSNIGTTTFKELEELFPHYFDTFDGFFMASPEHTYLHKPDLRMYLLFLETFDLKAEHTIFVDDRAENVLAARTVGMNTVLFSNPYHFECVLNVIRALPAQPKRDPITPQECTHYS